VVTAPATLDCQDCGEPIRRLTTEEVARIARNPYAFIVYCRACRADRAQEIEEGATNVN